MTRAAAHGKPVLLVLEGVLMYFGLAEVKAFFAQLQFWLLGAAIIFDIVPPSAVGKAKHHDALGKMKQGGKRSELEFKWSVKEAEELEY